MRREVKSLPDQPLRYFVRDDDIGELTPALKHFVATFVRLSIPVSYQIIPALLTEECATYLAGISRDYPDLIEFGQHGLRHRMNVRGKELKREFGPERSAAEQSSDIVEGLKMLHEKLRPDRPISLFTPPQHKFDRRTVQAIAAAGHTTFSAACYPTLHHRAAYTVGRSLGLSSLRHHGISYHGRRRPEANVRELSISIAVDNGRRITCPAEHLDAALKRAARHTDVVGLMFHHAVYSAAPSQLEAIADRLAAHSADRFHLLGRLAA
jgi:hypothetical protein